MTAALECQEKLRKLEPDLALPPGRRMIARIGLNSGSVLIGNIGGGKRFNYTVMGDPVNLAARLEGVNKVYGTSILTSAETARRCGNGIVFRELDKVRVLGRRVPVVICEALGLAAERTAEQKAQDAAFVDALATFRAGGYATARQQFQALAAEVPAARRLAEQCRKLIDHAPPEDWDGAWTLDQK